MTIKPRRLRSNLREEEFKMAENIRISIITDAEGRVVAAELPNQASVAGKEAAPTGHLLPLPGQRKVNIDIPKGVLRLSALDMQRYFSKVRISWPVEVQLPKIKIVKRSK